MDGTLKYLLQEPFGPYLEEEALTNALGNTTIKNPVVLDCLLLEESGKATGLTECELYQPEYNSKRFDSATVRFMGVLVIQSLQWLSEEAVISIEQELSHREHRLRLAENPHARLGSISLKTIYTTPAGYSSFEQRVRVKVRILGLKRGPVVYPQSDHVRNGLMMNSLNRRYAVNSLHILTYELSLLFLARYRLLFVLWNLVAIDGKTERWQDNKRTPLAERTPEWFAKLYIQHMAYAGAGRQHRPLYTSSDTDIEPSSKGVMKMGREHTLRHVPAAEIHYQLERHGDWIIQQVRIQKFDKWIDVDVWRTWLSDVRRSRRKVAKARHSRPRDASHRESVSSDGSKDEDNIPRPRQPPPPKRKNTNSKKSNVLSQHKAPTGAAQLASSSTTTPRTYMTNVNVNGYHERVYDSDFSPPSSPAEPDSEPSSPADPDVLAILPSEFSRLPQLTYTLKWVCPVEKCNYVIDLLNLTDENLDTDDVSEEDKLWLKRKAWNVNEKGVREAFVGMVGKHYSVHLDSWGIKLVLANGRWKAVWKDPRHPRSERLRVVPKDDRRPNIKKETV